MYLVEHTAWTQTSQTMEHQNSEVKYGSTAATASTPTALLDSAISVRGKKATSHVDPDITSKKILNNILKNYPHLTIILVTHSKELAKMTDKIYMIKNKKIELING